MNVEIKRQLVHALGISLILVLQIFGQFYSSIIFLGGFMFFLWWAYLRKSNIKVLGKIEEYFLKELKMYERSGEYFKGVATFFLGAFIVTVAFPINIAVAAIAVLAAADSISTLIGKTYGKHKLPINKKSTWEGSIAFFIVALGVLWFFDPSKALYVAAITTIVEMLPEIDDNLTIPLTVAILFMI